MDLTNSCLVFVSHSQNVDITLWLSGTEVACLWHTVKVVRFLLTVISRHMIQHMLCCCI